MALLYLVMEDRVEVNKQLSQKANLHKIETKDNHQVPNTYLQDKNENPKTKKILGEEKIQMRKDKKEFKVKKDFCNFHSQSLSNMY